MHGWTIKFLKDQISNNIFFFPFSISINGKYLGVYVNAHTSPSAAHMQTDTTGTTGECQDTIPGTHESWEM